jgi:hypothetical protein
MAIRMCSNEHCNSFSLIIIILGGLTVLILFVILLATLYNRHNNKQLNRVFEVQKQDPWTPYSVSSVVNYPELSSYSEIDFNEKV